MRWFGADRQGSDVIASAPAFVGGEWTHLVMTYDVAVLYNGGSGRPITSDGTVIATATTEHLTLGSFAGADHLRGTLRDVGVYSVVLHAEEIASIVGASAQNLDTHIVVDASTLDRTTGFTRKASLSAALLAASRQGAVIALRFDADCNHPFWYDNQTATRPQGAADSASGIWYTGTVKLNDTSHPFVISLSAIQTPEKNNYDVINIDLNGNGNFGDTGELLHRADVVAIGGKRYSVATGTWERLTPGHVRFTYPSSAELKEMLATYHAAGSDRSDGQRARHRRSQELSSPKPVRRDGRRDDGRRVLSSRSPRSRGGELRQLLHRWTRQLHRSGGADPHPQASGDETRPPRIPAFHGSIDIHLITQDIGQRGVAAGNAVNTADGFSPPGSFTPLWPMIRAEPENRQPSFNRPGVEGGTGGGRWRFCPQALLGFEIRQPFLRIAFQTPKAMIQW